MGVKPAKARKASGSQTDGPGIRSVSRKALPRAATADVAVGKAASVGGLPVRLSPVPVSALDERRRAGGRAAAPPGSVLVRVVGPAVARAAGVAGTVLALSRSDGTTDAAWVQIRLDYTSFTDTYGANFGQRLRLVRLPSCVLTTPADPRCQVRTPLGSVNKAGAVTADVTVSADTVVALDATSTSEAGTFTATSLSPAYAWSAGGQGGEFGFSYPLSVPPAPGGLVPELALGYSSGAVDGQTLARNGQTSWIGEGWDLQTGYIERDYRSCTQDGGTTGDLCWFSTYNATMVFNGLSTHLVRDNTTGQWKAADDDALRIEKLNDTSLGNGDNDGEYWKVTAQDGVQYFFGKHKRYATDPVVTNSVLRVPVYGNNSGEPCYSASGFAASSCDQAYRWQLDYVVDPHGNSMTYFYSRWSGYYGHNNNNGVALYELTGRLDHIDYGTLAGTEGASTAPMTVTFAKTERCVGGCTTAEYPDSPWDLRCTSSTSCPSLLSPAFWTPWKLSTVTAKVWDGSAYRQVDKWDLTHVFPATGDFIAPSGDDTSPNLWLQSITHTGYAADGTTSLAEPTMSFGGARLTNRVDWGDDIGVAPYTHYRLTSILTGSGAQTVVSYSGTECVRDFKPNPQANPYRCFPQYFTPQQAAPGWGWFHKYVVTQVVDKDLTGGSPDEVTSYAYSVDNSTDRSLWHHDFAETSQLQYRSWSLWRGYTTVTTTKGAAGDTQTVSKTLYHRGMDGDGMATTDNSGISWGSRRATITIPMGMVGLNAPVTGQSRRCLDAAGTADGSNVRLYDCNGTAGQVWRVHDPQSDGRFALRNPTSGRCLDITGAATANGADTQLYACNGQVQQWWQRQPNGSLRNPNSGRCLQPASWGTGNDTNIQIYDCGGHWNQNWQPAADGTLALPFADRCMDVTGGGTADGTAIQSYTCNGTENQVWRLEGSGALRNPQSNKCADITGGGTANGTLIQLYTCNGSAGQIWVPQANGTLRNPQSGRCLETPIWVPVGTQLRIWDCNGDLHQQWAHRIPDFGGLEGIAREEYTLDGTTLLGSTFHQYGITQTAVRSTPAVGGQNLIARRVRESVTRTRTWLAHNSTWRWTEAGYIYDSYGLPVDVTDAGNTTTGADNTCTHTDYARNTTTWMINFPSQVTVTDCTASPGPANTLGGTRTYYDDSTTLGTAPTRGLATQTSKLASYTGATANWITATTNTYDQHGRPLTATDALNRTTETAYTPATGGPVTSVTATNPADHEATTTLGVRGQSLSTVDANGRTTNTAYDPLGRLIKVWLPGRTTAQTPNTEYVYTLSNTTANHVQTKVLGPNGNQISSFQIYDGRMRSRQVQTTAPDGKRAIADTHYDSRGLTVKTSAVYNNASAPTGMLVTFADVDVATQRRYTHDTLGRKTEEALWSLNVELQRTTTTYDGDRTSIDPPSGATATTTITDGTGRTTALRQYHGAAPTGTYDETSYGHDRLDRLTSVIDSAGNTWTNSYDRRGQLTSKTDPDAGTSSFSYDDAGQLLTSTDGRGEVIYHVYDNLGRQTELRDDNATGTKRASWLFDTIAKGHLASSTRWIGSDAYTSAVTGYTDLYKPTGATVTIPAVEGALAGDYTTADTYKVDGSLATTVLPGVGGLPAETLTYSYSDAGLPTTMASGSGTYVASTSYHWDGAINQRILGITANKRIRITNTLDDATRRLKTVQVDTENAITANNWDDRSTTGYTYDPAGNITVVAGKTDGVQDQAECFRYDHLRRLTEAWTEATPSCLTPQRTGADPYWRAWTYDVVGNRKTQVVHGASGDTTSTYTYPTAGTAQPHTLTSVAHSGPAGSTTDSYTYDQAGNTATRTITGVGQTLTWDPEGKLAQATKAGQNTTYIYDAAGNRVLRKEPAATTLYLPDGTELRLATGTNQPDGTRYYDHNGATVGVRTVTGLTRLVADHHGTAELAITDAGVTRRRSLPFGEPRGTQPAGWVGDKRFVGGTQDASTDLTHLGAREYDPTTGRFISLDPIMDLTDPQQMHGFTYASNNPLTWSDPDGLIESDCMDHDCYGYVPTWNGGCPYGCGSTKNVKWGKKHKKRSTKQRSPQKLPKASKLPNLPDWDPTPRSDQGEHPEWNSAGYWDRFWHDTIMMEEYAAARVFQAFFCTKGPNACAQWGHWLGGSGEDMIVDPSIFMDEDNFSVDVLGAIEQYKAMASAQCAASSCSYTFDSGWKPTLGTSPANPVKEDYAGMGQVQVNVTGSVNVSRGKDGAVSVSGSYGISIRKDWNFDPGEYPSRGDTKVRHRFSELHQYGYAKDFVLRGTSGVRRF
ncbi:hypothetical protein GCM10023263_93880 [Phytohabitans rumicis]